MAEVTKRKLTAIYSIIAGFFLSLFSGHAHSGEIFYPSKKTVSATKNAPKLDNSIKITPTTGTEQIQAPTSRESAVNTNPSVGTEAAPAPDANKSIIGGDMNIENVEDGAMRSFMQQRAVEQGLNPNGLSSQEFNNIRMDYLLLKITNLEQQLNEH